MQTEFFLLNASFECPNNMEIEVIEEAIQGMSRDYDYIKKHKDKVSKHESIYDVELYEKYQVADLYSKKGLFSRDTQKFLLKIIDHSEETTWSNEEAFDLIVEQEKENLCETKVNYGLLALFRVRNEVPESYTVYNQLIFSWNAKRNLINGWRRYVYSIRDAVLIRMLLLKATWRAKKNYRFNLGRTGFIASYT